MILYHAITNYHILEMMLYKKMFHSDEEVILILPDFIKKKLPFYMDLEEQGFFDKVYEFPYVSKRVEFANDESSIKREFKEIVGVGIENFDEIYIAGSQYCFTKYVLSENLMYYNFEEGQGALSNYEGALASITKLDYAMGTWSRENEILSGKNKNIIKNICNVSAQSFELEVDNVLDFNVAEVLKHTDRSYIDKIKKFFKAPENLKVGEKTAVLLTQHLANVKLMSVEEQINMYQLMIDFYAQNYNVVIKRHPDDWVDYEKYLQDIQQIDNLFPVELLPYISTEGEFDAVITVNSRSVANITEVIYAGRDFIYDYKEIVKIYYTLKLIGKTNYKKNIFVNGYEEIVKNLVKYTDINLDINTTIFLNETEIEDLEINNEIVFVIGKMEFTNDFKKLLDKIEKTDSDLFLLNEYDFVNDADKFKKIKIEKTQIKEIIISDIEDEYIYLKAERDYTDIKLFKKLEQTGIMTRVVVEN